MASMMSFFGFVYIIDTIFLLPTKPQIRSPHRDT